MASSSSTTYRHAIDSGDLPCVPLRVSDSTTNHHHQEDPDGLRDGVDRGWGWVLGEEGRKYRVRPLRAAFFEGDQSLVDLKRKIPTLAWEHPRRTLRRTENVPGTRRTGVHRRGPSHREEGVVDEVVGTGAKETTANSRANWACACLRSPRLPPPDRMTTDKTAREITNELDDATRASDDAGNDEDDEPPRRRDVSSRREIRVSRASPGREGVGGRGGSESVPRRTIRSQSVDDRAGDVAGRSFASSTRRREIASRTCRTDLSRDFSVRSRSPTPPRARRSCCGRRTREPPRNA